MTKSAKQIIEELNQLDENLQLEAKSGLGESLLETVCAYANEPGLGGGTILIGAVRDDESLFPFYTVTGVKDTDAMARDLASQCASVFNVPLRPTIRSEQVDGKNVLIVEVQEASAAEKPIFFKKHNLPRGAYRRIGSTDQKCTEDDLIVLYGQREAHTYDDRIVSGATMNDIDPAAIEYYRTLRKRVNPAAEELEWSDPELLQALSAIHIEGGVLKPTLVGILIFGTRQALRRLIPTMRIDYIRIPGKEWVENPDERFSTSDMRGPLLSLVQRVQDQVFEDLPKAFALAEGKLQAESQSLPSRVLREAIVNAVMHASYRVHQPIQILRYNNRIEIRNPGYSLKNEDQLGQPGSRLRNPKLAAVFHETNLAETKGSGIRTMRKLMEDAGFAPPTFESDRANDIFTARLLLHHFLTPEDLAWLKALKIPDLSDAQKKALIFVRESGAIDNATCRQLNALDSLAASNELRRLRDLDLLSKKGKSTNTYYVAGAKLLANMKVETHQLPAETHQLIVETHHLSRKKHQLGNNLKIQKLPKDLRDVLETQKKRPGKDVIKELILKMCQHDSWSKEELAAILKIEDAKYLRREYLTPMIKTHHLCYTQPDMVNHPEQGYKIGPAAQTEE